MGNGLDGPEKYPPITNDERWFQEIFGIESMTLVGFLWQIRWVGYKPIPEGMPLVWAEYFALSDGHSGARKPKEMDGLAYPDGYHLSVTPISKPIKPMEIGKKIQLRQKKLRKRMTHKYPMFAEQFSEEEIARKKDYYMEGKGRFDEEREKILQAETARFKQLMSNAGKLIINSR